MCWYEIWLTESRNGKKNGVGKTKIKSKKCKTI